MENKKDELKGVDSALDALSSDETFESQDQEAPKVKPARQYNIPSKKKPPVFLSKVASHKANTKYFTKSSIGVKTLVFKNGVLQPNGEEQSQDAQFFRKRFPRLIETSDQLPTKRKDQADFEELRRQVRQHIPNRQVQEQILNMAAEKVK